MSDFSAGRFPCAVRGSRREAWHRSKCESHRLGAAVILLIFAIFFLVIRRAIHRTLKTVSPYGRQHYSPAEASQKEVRAILRKEARPPMDPSIDPTIIDVFVSGHTHLPSLVEAEGPDGTRPVMVNSGCFLRQLQPVTPHLKGPPVFISRFVLTHVRIYRSSRAAARGALGPTQACQPEPNSYRAPPLSRAPAPQPFERETSRTGVRQRIVVRDPIRTDRRRHM
jgi:hypothetical protein